MGATTAGGWVREEIWGSAIDPFPTVVAVQLSLYRIMIYRILIMARKSKAGPASDPELLILSSLASGPKHGYAIKSDIQSIAGIDLGPGTLYTAIARLVEKKWISPQAEKGRQRPYKLTADGTKQLKDQLQQIRRLATVGLGRLGKA